MKIAICDDEARMLDEVSSHINKYSMQHKTENLEVYPFNSAWALDNAIGGGERFDIFLLDVYIGDEMGTELAKDIRAKGIKNPIVFLTTSVEHAPESFETDTLRYLIKPINPQKLYEALNAAVARAKKLGSKFIKLKTDNGVENVNIANIVYTESHSHYQYVNFTEGVQMRTRMTVSELFGKLSEFGGFVRGGSAYIINLNNVKSISTSEVCFNNDTRLLLPRGAHSEIKEAFWEFQYEGQEG